MKMEEKGRVMSWAEYRFKSLWREARAMGWDRGKLADIAEVLRHPHPTRPRPNGTSTLAVLIACLHEARRRKLEKIRKERGPRPYNLLWERRRGARKRPLTVAVPERKTIK